MKLNRSELGAILEASENIDTSSPLIERVKKKINKIDKPAPIYSGFIIQDSDGDYFRKPNRGVSSYRRYAHIFSREDIEDYKFSILNYKLKVTGIPLYRIYDPGFKGWYYTLEAGITNNKYDAYRFTKAEIRDFKNSHVHSHLEFQKI